MARRKNNQSVINQQSINNRAGIASCQLIYSLPLFFQKGGESMLPRSGNCVVDYYEDYQNWIEELEEIEDRSVDESEEINNVR